MNNAREVGEYTDVTSDFAYISHLATAKLLVSLDETVRVCTTDIISISIITRSSYASVYEGSCYDGACDRFLRSENPARLRYPQVVTSTLLAVCIRQRPMFRQMLFLVPDVLCGPFCNSIHKTQLGRNVKCVNLRNSSCQQMKRVSERGCKAGTFRYNLNTVIQY